MHACSCGAAGLSPMNAEHIDPAPNPAADGKEQKPAALATDKTVWGASADVKPSKYPPATHMFSPGGKTTGIYKGIRRVYIALQGPHDHQESAWTVCLVCKNF